MALICRLYGIVCVLCKTRFTFPRINGPIAAKQVKKQCCAFYHPRSNLSCNKSGCCRLWKVPKGRAVYFLLQNLFMLRVLPAQGKLVFQQVTKWRISSIWRDSRVILSCQKSVLTKYLQQPDLLVKRAISLFYSFCSIVAMKLETSFFLMLLTCPMSFTLWVI